MPRDGREQPSPDVATQRLDKWLWFARIVRSRTAAAGLIGEGKVRVNRTKIEKPGTSVKVGDVVTVVAHHRVRVLEVQAPGHRRGPPREAHTLFNEISSDTGPTARISDLERGDLD